MGRESALGSQRSKIDGGQTCGKGWEEEDGMNWEIRIDISHSVSQFSRSVVSDSL